MAAAYDAIYPSLHRVVMSEKPDVLLCDYFSPACRDVAEMAGVPLIMGFQTTDRPFLCSIPGLTSSAEYGSVVVHELNLFARIHDKLVTPILQSYHNYPTISSLNKMRRKYNVPPSYALFGDFSRSLALANTFVGFEPALPTPPNVRLVGPVRADAYEELHEHLNTFLNLHPRTLYISCGSKMVLPDFDINLIMSASMVALEQGSIDGIVWALGATTKDDFPSYFDYKNSTKHELMANPDLVMLPWLPQNAVLNHESTRLFLSHAGIESSFDAILAATPILAMPFFGDQPRNTRKLEDAGIAQYVDRIIATPAILAAKIAYMLQDPQGTISTNLHRMQTIAQSASQRKHLGATAIEEYAYVARICRPSQPHQFGQIPCEAKHLVPVSRTMSNIKANLLDVYLAIITALFLLPAIITYKIFSTCTRRSKRKVKSN
ncbi:hypothetical protein DSO57_1009903 [Entomophthora muscae]|uniref:Uncharacterized protein n=1 Tax=Entomophthora muscae TaxID=34485 RepID=A0ACC2U576_9FUNG|nr:hypothetical protein DSO57_1009903 [Entomophthora muscae]